tara:strand:+ start:705 stop:1844 length:1140 start_codon:yes stop_codon:yes gene_type:complete
MLQLLLLHLVFATNFEVIERVGTSSNQQPAQAKKEILDKLIEEVSLENISAILGEETTNKKLKQIRFKILPNYGKYIPYVKQGNLNRSTSPWSMKVTMNFSRKALRDILLQEGILHFSSDEIKILPFVSFLDKKYSKSYKWWFVDNNYRDTLVFSEARSFQQLLRDMMWEESFFVMNPIEGELHNFIPSKFLSVSYSSSELQSLGESLDAQMVVAGQVHYGPSPKNSMALQMEIELEAVLVASGRKVAHTTKTLETPAGSYEANLTKYASDFYKEAIAQFTDSIMNSWRKGLFDTQRVQLRVYDQFSYKELNAFKDLLQTKSLKLKNLVDRSFAPGYVVFEADVSQGAAALIEDLKDFRWRGKKAKVWKTDDREIRIEI